ncbi:MAG: hypothetical protein ACRDPK_15110 [Carbonactinosporaceae bacterium]
MLDGGWLDHGDAAFAVTADGAAEFGRLGVDLAACRRTRRQFARPCLDWTQRRTHLAGALGAAVATALTNRGWLRPDSADRGVRITTAGQAGLRATFGIDTARLLPGEGSVTDARPRGSDPPR